MRGVSLANGTARIDVDVSRLIDTRPLVPLQKLIIVLCGLVVLLDGYDIQTMALAVPSIAAEWKIASSTFGLALSASLIGLMGGAGLIARCWSVVWRSSAWRPCAPRIPPLPCIWSRGAS